MKRLVVVFFALLALLGALEAQAQAAPPTVSLVFSPNTIANGGEATHILTINNPSTTPIVGGTIASYTYAAGLVIAPVPAEFIFGCGAAPVVNITPGAGGISASALDIAASGSCNIWINVTAATGGTYTNVFPVGGFSGNTGGNAASASATLTVNAPFVVTNTNDTGAGSLRQALSDVNANCATRPYNITFNIPGGGPQTIQPLSALPAVACATTGIDGFTQPGSAPNSALAGFDNAVQVIAIDGSLCSGCEGLSITAGDVTVRGLQILKFPGNGISINDATFVGSINLNGNRMTNNGGSGVRLDSGSVQLGDGTAAGQNVIAANSAGGVLVAAGDLRAHHDIVENNTGRGMLFQGGGGEVLDSFVRGNSLAGIVVTTLQDVVIMGTASYNNGGPGIDLNGDGPTLNDEAAVPYDTDSGPNQLLNYPVVTSVTHIGTDTKIDGYWKTEAFSFPGTIELWENLSAGAPTEGQTKILSFQLNVDANGFGPFSVTVNGTFSIVSAQATMDACGDGCVISSEFSPKVVVSLPALSVSTASLTFAQQQVGTTSAAQTVTLTNTGTATLLFTSIATSADFGRVTTCGATLAPASSCTVDVTFSPSSGGNIAGSLTIQSDAPGSPHTVSLQGVGVTAPGVTMAFAPSSIFVGGTATLTTTLSNPNTLAATNIAVTITYSAGLVNAAVVNTTNTCRSGSASSATPGGGGAQWTGLSVPAGGSCAVSIDVTAGASGTFTATIAAGGMTSDQGSNASAVTATLTVTVAPQPAVSLNVTTIDFGSASVGSTSATQDIIITNTGTASLTIASAAVTAEFVRAATPRCDGVVLAPSQTCTEKVAFAPASIGAKTGTWSVTSNAPGSPHSVSLAGQGVAAPVPAVSLAPTSLTFPPQTVGTTSAPQNVTLTNSGTGPLNIASIGTTGDFAKSTACPATLAAGASCQISVTFTPLVVGGRIGELKVFSDASGSPHVVALSGTGTALPAPVLTMSATALVFPDTLVGATSPSQVVVITNTGNAPLVIGALIPSGMEFPFTSSCGGSLAPSASCDITAQFQPAAIGSRSGSIAIHSNASGSPHSLSLSGSGFEPTVGILSPEPPALAFPGSTVVGAQSAALSVTLTNTGGAPVSIEAIAITAHFELVSSSGSCVSLAPGESCVLSVRFAPTLVGGLTGTLTVESNASEPTLEVPLSGTAVANPFPVATLSATSLGFGNRFVAAPSPPMEVTLTNTGLSPLVISSIFATGDFSASSPCPGTLAPGASCTITVRMLARLAGGRFGTLRIVTNAAGSPALVDLSGTGCTPWSMARARLGLGMSCAPGS